MALNILVGADPEVFVRKKGKKQFLSAHGLIVGDKANPQKVPLGAVQVDGMALEFNIDPAKDEKEFVKNLQGVMKTLGDMVPDYELVPAPVATFTAAHMAKQPMEAKELGCEPDFCAWNNGQANPRPNGDVNFRTGAGHVHIGWGEGLDINDPEHREACIMVAKQLDYYLGLGSLIYDSDVKRRSLYGAPGAFRPKPYGVEYRTLSNAWLQSAELMSWVFRMTKLGVDRLFEGKPAYGVHGWSNWDDWLRRELMSKNPDHYSINGLLKKRNIESPPGYVFSGKVGKFVKV